MVKYMLQVMYVPDPESVLFPCHTEWWLAKAFLAVPHDIVTLWWMSVLRARILAQSCVTSPYIIKAKGLCMIVLVSLIVLLRGLLVSTIFHIVHPIPTSPFIQLNDFALVPHILFLHKCSYAHV